MLRRTTCTSAKIKSSRSFQVLRKWHLMREREKFSLSSFWYFIVKPHFSLYNKHAYSSAFPVKYNRDRHKKPQHFVLCSCFMLVFWLCSFVLFFHFFVRLWNVFHFHEAVVIIGVWCARAYAVFVFIVCSYQYMCASC